MRRSLGLEATLDKMVTTIKEVASNHRTITMWVDPQHLRTKGHGSRRTLTKFVDLLWAQENSFCSQCVVYKIRRGLMGNEAENLRVLPFLCSLQAVKAHFAVLSTGVSQKVILKDLKTEWLLIVVREVLGLQVLRTNLDQQKPAISQHLESERQRGRDRLFILVVNEGDDWPDAQTALKVGKTLSDLMKEINDLCGGLKISFIICAPESAFESDFLYHLNSSAEVFTRIPSKLSNKEVSKMVSLSEALALLFIYNLVTEAGKQAGSELVKAIGSFISRIGKREVKKFIPANLPQDPERFEGWISVINQPDNLSTLSQDAKLILRRCLVQCLSRHFDAEEMKNKLRVDALLGGYIGTPSQVRETVATELYELAQKEEKVHLLVKAMLNYQGRENAVRVCIEQQLAV